MKFKYTFSTAANSSVTKHSVENDTDDENLFKSAIGNVKPMVQDTVLPTKRIAKQKKVLAKHKDKKAVAELHRMGKETKDLSIPRVNISNVSLEVFPNSIEHWLKSLNDSDYIVTESFHCVIFSLIFRKNFICILNDLRGTARIESILNQVGLSHLMIRLDSKTSALDIEQKLKSKIDYDKVWNILNKEIRFSKNYLNESLIN